uniref:P1 n=1 Tax=Colobanthus quitensis associated barnavirus 1 TaxID=2116708 RepID=A0A2P1JMX3_9VIRU|nr:P1 [Colobanthus quitensis associated barnavirus 1]
MDHFCRSGNYYGHPGRFMDHVDGGKLCIVNCSGGFIHRALGFDFAFGSCYSIQVLPIPSRQQRSWVDNGFHHYVTVAKLDGGFTDLERDWKFIGRFALKHGKRFTDWAGVGQKNFLANERALLYLLCHKERLFTVYHPGTSYVLRDSVAINRGTILEDIEKDYFDRLATFWNLQTC